MNLLVTGAGLAGCYTARAAVQQGHRVVLVDVAPRPSYIRQIAGDVPVVRADVRDLPALVETMRTQAIDVVFHSAYLIGDRLAERPYMGLQANVGGLIAVAEAVRLCGVARLVFASTYGVYNWALPPTTPVAEDFPVRTDVFYRASKIACESLLQAYAHEYDFQWVVLRFAQLYGPGHYVGGDAVGLVLQEIVEMAIGDREESLEVQASRFGSNELIYAKDLARGVLLACERPLPAGNNHVYNLGSGVVTDTPTLAGTLRAVFPGVAVDVAPGPATRFVPHRPQPLDLTRIRSELGFLPEYDLARGLREFAAELQTGGASTNPGAAR